MIRFSFKLSPETVSAVALPNPGSTSIKYSAATIDAVFVSGTSNTLKVLLAYKLQRLSLFFTRKNILWVPIGKPVVGILKFSFKEATSATSILVPLPSPGSVLKYYSASTISNMLVSGISETLKVLLAYKLQRLSLFFTRRNILWVPIGRPEVGILKFSSKEATSATSILVPLPSPGSVLK